MPKQFPPSEGGGRGGAHNRRHVQSVCTEAPPTWERRWAGARRGHRQAEPAEPAAPAPARRQCRHGPAPAPAASAGTGPVAMAGASAGPGAETDASAGPGPVAATGDRHMLHHLECPITLQLPTNPFTAEDGRIYEGTAIQTFFAGCFSGGKRGTVVSPTTNEPMGRKLLPAPHIRQLIEEAIEKCGVLPPDVAEEWLERDKAEKKAALKATEEAALAGDSEACAKMMDASSDKRDKQRWAYLGMLDMGPGAAAVCAEFFGSFGSSLYFSELNKMTLLALFESANTNGDNCAIRRPSLRTSSRTSGRLRSALRRWRSA